MPFPCHVSDPGSPGRGTVQNRQTSLPGGLIECRHEPAHAFIAAGRPRDHQITDRQRRAGGVVVLPPVRHLRVPQQRAGMTVERDDVRVIGHHEHAVAGDADAAVDAAGRIADQPLRPRTLVMPDLTPAARRRAPSIRSRS